MREGNLGRVFSEWAGREPEAAGNWLSARGNDPNYDAMARSYSAAVAGFDAEGALEWARSIRDDGQRQAAVTGAAAQRLKTGGEAAIADLRLAGLTEEELSQAIAANEAKPVQRFTFASLPGFGGTGNVIFTQASEQGYAVEIQGGGAEGDSAIVEGAAIQMDLGPGRGEAQTFGDILVVREIVLPEISLEISQMEPGPKIQVEPVAPVGK